VLIPTPAGEDGLLAVGALTPASLFAQALAQVLDPGSGALAFVTDAGGRLLYQSGEFLAGEVPADHPGVREALGGKSGADFIQVGSEEHAYAYSPIQPVGWALVFEEPWEAVASPMLRLTEAAPLALIPVLLLAMLALWYGARWVVQPLQKLEAQASELGWGDSTAIEQPVGGIAEIRRLQNELIDLARKVRASQAGLRGYIGAMTEGQEEERRRLARELHDDTLQALVALNQRVQLAHLDVNNEPSMAGISRALVEIQSLTDQTIQGLRRFTQALRPTYLEELGLSAALDMLARENDQPGGISVQFWRSGQERRLPPAVELALYRPEEVTLSVQDDGLGFSVPESPAEFAPGGHFGFLGMHERAEGIGARLDISFRPGQGTRVSVILPSPASAENQAAITDLTID
jgi:two-component system sensor histidine kinase UhpB